MMMMTKMIMLLVSLLLCSHFSAECFPLKGCVCESVGDTTRLTFKHTSVVNLTCVCLSDCWQVVQLDVSDSVIQLKEHEKHGMLEDECVKLMKDLSAIEEPKEVSALSVVTPLVAAVIFVTLLLLSFSMFKRQKSPAGGVLGSLIHYPAHSLENSSCQTIT